MTGTILLFIIFRFTLFPLVLLAFVALIKLVQHFIKSKVKSKPVRILVYILVSILVLLLFPKPAGSLRQPQIGWAAKCHGYTFEVADITFCIGIPYDYPRAIY
jgi:hypothetical protein